MLNETAKKRLKAILQYTELGSGFYLSLRDLEIRGAGNLLGPQQHGFIQDVGYDLYLKLLDETIRELKGEKVVKEPDTKIRVDLDLFIPTWYIQDKKQRVEIYQKIADSKTQNSLEDLKKEIADRFGKPPQQISDLLILAQCKLIAKKNLISRIWLKKDRLGIEFDSTEKMSKKRAEQFRKKVKLPVEFKSSGISIDLKREKITDKAFFIRKVLQNL
jgi:transcription-repair coupling factor (superfamily II helicase)